MKRLGTRHLWVLTPVLAVAVSAARPMVDNSMLWHVEAGRLQLAAGEVLRSDPFSFTFLGEGWRTQSWLADIGYATLESWMPEVGWVPWMLTVSGMALMTLLAVDLYRETRSPALVGASLAVVFVILTRFLVPRPVVLSLVLFAAVVVASRHRSTHWTLPLLLWVWAAVHGSWILGIGFLVLESIRLRSRRLALVGVVGVVAATLTAHGVAVWQILWRFAMNREALDVIQEWQRPDLFEIQFLPYLVGILAIGAAMVRRRVTLLDLVVIVPFAVFGLTSARATLPALIVLAPYAIRSFEGIGMGAGSRSVINAGLAAGLTVTALAVAATAATGPHPDRFPVDAAGFITPSATFHSDVVGGYLIYRGETVFVDDRAELYGATFFREYQAARDGEPGWEALFEEHGISAALLDVDDGLVAALEDAGWAQRYRDDVFVVLADDP